MSYLETTPRVLVDIIQDYYQDYVRWDDAETEGYQLVVTAVLTIDKEYGGTAITSDQLLITRSWEAVQAQLGTIVGSWDDDPAAGYMMMMYDKLATLACDIWQTQWWAGQ